MEEEGKEVPGNPRDDESYGRATPWRTQKTDGSKRGRRPP